MSLFLVMTLITGRRNIGSEKEVFFAAINTEGQLYISRGLERMKGIHDIRH